MKKALIFTILTAVFAGPAFAQDTCALGYGCFGNSDSAPATTATLASHGFGYTPPQGSRLMPHGSCRFGNEMGETIGTDNCFDGRGVPRPGVGVAPDGTAFVRQQVRIGQPMPGYGGYRQPMPFGQVPRSAPAPYGGQHVTVDEDGMGSQMVGNNLIGELVDAGINYCLQSLAFRGKC